jgi:predicted nucleic acid-binding protein
MDKPSVYIETSIVSYLAARPSRDPQTLRNQQLTHAWWNTRREEYALYTSDLVLTEAASGDAAMARRRIALLSTIPLLEPHDRAGDLAHDLRVGVPLPPQANTDALHIALAALYGMSYLLTWDSKHIANPKLRLRISGVCLARGCLAPSLCTPTDVMGD